MSALLEIQDVAVQFGGVRALDGVSLRVERGEIVGLIGPNGAGKTTLFNCVSGVVRPQQGTVRFEEQVITTLRPHRRARLGIARTFQALQLFEGLTVTDNLMVALDATSPRNMVSDALRLPTARYQERHAQERARSILHFLGLLDVAGASVGSLSIRQRRQVELGRALCARPALLLLDEPAAGLDPQEGSELAATLFRIRDQLRVSMLLVDHDMSLVMRVCDQVNVVDFGRVIASGPPAQVRADPGVVRAYLGEEAA